MQKTSLAILSIFLVLLVSGFAVADSLGESGETTGSDGPTSSDSVSSDDSDSTTPTSDETAPTSEPTLTTEDTTPITPTSDETFPITPEPELTSDDSSSDTPTSDEPTSTDSGPGFESDGSDSDTPTSDESSPVNPVPTLDSDDSDSDTPTEDTETETTPSPFVLAVQTFFGDILTFNAQTQASQDDSSGGSDQVCEWTCTEWSACSLSGEQSRTCTGSDGCSIVDDSPATSQSCTVPATQLSQPTEEITTEAAQDSGSTETAEETGFFSRITGAVISPNGRPTGLGLAAAFILVVVIAYFVVRLRK